ncbi:hypothetical protein [Sphingomonas sp.]|uniref:hypothetical protein n=1 Tax=Sphingomonas sp. TaxID=28214 RepID=UPI003CC5E413
MAYNDHMRRVIAEGKKREAERKRESERMRKETKARMDRAAAENKRRSEQMQREAEQRRKDQQRDNERHKRDTAAEMRRRQADQDRRARDAQQQRQRADDQRRHDRQRDQDNRDTERRHQERLQEDRRAAEMRVTWRDDTRPGLEDQDGYTALQHDATPYGRSGPAADDYDVPNHYARYASARRPRWGRRLIVLGLLIAAITYVAPLDRARAWLARNSGMPALAGAATPGSPHAVRQHRRTYPRCSTTVTDECQQ